LPDKSAHTNYTVTLFLKSWGTTFALVRSGIIRGPEPPSSVFLKFF
jgi:hypothetical protein